MPPTTPLLLAGSILTLAAAMGPKAGQDGPPSAGDVALGEAFAAAGLHVDVAAGVCALPAEVLVRDELLEYLLVLPHGAAHESLLRTRVDAELLNAALLALGAKPGKNAEWAPKDPAPTEEELRAGASPYDVRVPAGDGFFPYVAWREGEETYFYRAEDLVRDLERGRGMQRHRWVYLGSRIVERGARQEEVFAASAEGNLINVAFFAQGNTLLTGSLEACVQQTVWLPNAWLLPPRESSVLFLLSTERLSALPAALAERIPVIEPGEPRDEDRRR